MFAPAAPRVRVTTEGIIRPSHSDMVAWAAASREFWLSAAADATAQAESCDNSVCTVREHIADAHEAMQNVRYFTAKSVA